MMFTCAICGRYTFQGSFGLCTLHLKEYSLTGTYCESTPTGTYALPEWVRIFAKEHHLYEKRKVNREIPFSHLEKENRLHPDSVEAEIQAGEEGFPPVI